MTTTWRKVTPKRPCVVCSKPDWCTFAADDGAACCMRVESPRRMKNGGYLHKGAGDRGEAVATRERTPKPTDWEALTQFYVGRFSKPQREDTAKLLGVTVDALARLRTGFDGEALTFPMSDAKGRVIGIRRRLADASKTCVLGSKTGLFVPSGIDDKEYLVITEGPTDCAAILSIGLAAVGRPACNGGVDYLIELVGKRPAILIADNDPEGHQARKHTENSIARLRGAGMTLDVVWPPVKDARAWVQAGLTMEMLFEKAGKDWTWNK